MPQHMLFGLGKSNFFAKAAEAAAAEAGSKRYHKAKVTAALCVLEKDGSLEDTRVLRKSDREYMAKFNTDRTPHAAFLDRVSKFLTCFVVSNVILLLLATALLGLSIYEHVEFGVYPSSVLVIVTSAVLLLAAIAGLVGASRLKEDLKDDDDGEETPAQRFIEVYFWVLSVLWVVFVTAAILVLANGEPDFEDMARQDPKKFNDFAEALGVETGSFSNAVADVESQVHTINHALSGVLLGLAARD